MTGEKRDRYRGVSTSFSTHQSAFAPQPSGPASNSEIGSLGNLCPVGSRHQAGGHIGMSAHARRRRLDHRPGGRVGDQSTEYRVVELVPAAHRAIGAKNRRPGEGKIADRIEYLVT